MLGLGAVMIVAASVFWVFDALPFQDLPAHAGLIAMRHRFETSAFEQRFYVLAPHIGPYSLFRFLGEVFVRLSGPIDAVRALGTLPVLATPLAMLFARRRLYGDSSPAFGFLGVALSFGIMTLLGFASYLLGVAVTLVGLTLWLDLLTAADGAADPRALRRHELVVTAFAPLISRAGTRSSCSSSAPASRPSSPAAASSAWSASARSSLPSPSPRGSRGSSAGPRLRRGRSRASST